MSKRFRFIFFIRFLGYLVFFTGLLSFIFMLGPLVQAEVGYRKDKLFGVKRTVPKLTTLTPGENTSFGTKPTPNVPKEGNGVSVGDSGAGFETVKSSEESITPVSTEYGIVIEKINANAGIIPNVNPGNEKEYTQALTRGVAEALGSTPPGQPGNLYLFSHSTNAPWNIVRYNAIFYLLRELEKGDKVIIFYQNRRYDYVVFDKAIARPDDVSYLTNRYDFPVLTLQTCDPPGTLLNRLIVRARLVNS